MASAAYSVPQARVLCRKCNAAAAILRSSALGRGASLSRSASSTPTFSARWSGPQRSLSSSSVVKSHENPLGLPRNNERRPPTMPRRGQGMPEKRPIPHVKHVVVVSSGKGGVGKSTISANLAVALSLSPSRAAETSQGKRGPRIGLLDLDIFGPSVPKLMGLQNAGEPELSGQGALLPLRSHGVACMSMGFLLPASKQPRGLDDLSDDPDEAVGNEDTPVVWRGMMVMKAVQQLLFDVDWRGETGGADEGLDVLVIDMPPGTGDVALSLSQLVKVDCALVVSTPQEVALLDARKGIALFRKTDIPIAGLVLNMSHFVSPDTGKSYELFGKSDAFEKLATRLNVPVLGKVPLEPRVSEMGDEGQPVALQLAIERDSALLPETVKAFASIAEQIWGILEQRK